MLRRRRRRRRSTRRGGKGDNFGGISPYDGGFESEELEASVEAEGRGGDGDGVENPRRGEVGAELSGGEHGGEPGRGECADVEAEGVGAWGEVVDLLK